MLRINPDVKLGLCPEIVLASVVADGVFAGRGLECVVTSGTEGAHKPDSYHYRKPGQAVDLRIRHAPLADWKAIADELRSRLGPTYRVLLELNPPHLHVEWRG